MIEFSYVILDGLYFVFPTSWLPASGVTPKTKDCFIVKCQLSKLLSRSSYAADT